MGQLDQEYEFAIIALNKGEALVQQLHAALLQHGYGITELKNENLELLFNLSTLDDAIGFFIVNLSDKDGKVDTEFYLHVIELSKKLNHCVLYHSSNTLRELVNSFKLRLHLESVNPLSTLETLDSYGITARRLIARDAELFLKH